MCVSHVCGSSLNSIDEKTCDVIAHDRDSSWFFHLIHLFIHHVWSAHISPSLLTWLQCWPFLTGDSHILELDVAVAEEESQWFTQSFHIEVKHFVFWHCFFFFFSVRIFFNCKLSILSVALYNFLHTFVCRTALTSNLHPGNSQTRLEVNSPRKSKVDWSGWSRAKSIARTSIDFVDFPSRTIFTRDSKNANSKIELFFERENFLLRFYFRLFFL